MKKMNKKGFTLMELLIVVAIIAVLIAITIPVLTAQLEKARDAVSVANLRTAYAEAQMAYLLGGDGTHVTITLDGSDIDKITVTDVVFKGKKTESPAYSGLAAELPFTPPTEPAAGTYKVIFDYNADGSISGVTTSS